MNIIFYNCGHIGDLLFSKSFIKQFCENNINYNISYIIHYNSFLFSDINNLNLIIPNNDNIYNNNDFNGGYDPINSINITNNLYIEYINFFKNKFDNINYTIHNNNIYIKLWIGDCTSNYNCTDLECNIINLNNYYNNIINDINNKYGFNITLINNINLLPNIPYTNIDNFLLYRNNKNIIFYYNYNPNSEQIINTDHEYNIKYLSEKYNNYIICCAVKPIYNNYNIISMDDFGYIKSPTCENIANTLYCAMNSDIVISFDIGACFYYLNDLFEQSFKGIWYHVSCNDKYYKKINDILKNNKIILLKSDITSYI